LVLEKKSDRSEVRGERVRRIKARKGQETTP